MKRKESSDHTKHLSLFLLGREEFTVNEERDIKAKKAENELWELMNQKEIMEMNEDSGENSIEDKIFLAKLKKKMEKA